MTRYFAYCASPSCCDRNKVVQRIEIPAAERDAEVAITRRADTPLKPRYCSDTCREAAKNEPTPKEPCVACGKNMATENFSESMLHFTHGMSSRWCARCVLEEQLDYAEKAAARIQKIKDELAACSPEPISAESKEAWYKTHPCSRFAGWAIAVVQHRPDGTRPGYDGEVQDEDVGAVAPGHGDLLKVIDHLREMGLLKTEVVIW